MTRCESIWPDGPYPPKNEAAWYSESSGLDNTPTHQITYGMDAPGLRTQHGPGALTPAGCYVMHVYGRLPHGNGLGGTIGFNVDSSGKIVQMIDEERDAVASARAGELRLYLVGPPLYLGALSR